MKTKTHKSDGVVFGLFKPDLYNIFEIKKGTSESERALKFSNNIALLELGYFSTAIKSLKREFYKFNIATLVIESR